jgi:hypothetical protein
MPDTATLHDHGSTGSITPPLLHKEIEFEIEFREMTQRTNRASAATA